MKKNKSSTKWISLMGRSKTEGEKLIYVPTKNEEGPSEGQYSPCIAKSNIDFESGKIRFNVTFKATGEKCQVVLNHGAQHEVFVGYNFGRGSFGIMNYSGGKWENVVTVGDQGSLPLNQKIKTEIIVRGSVIDLFIDDVKVCSGVSQISKSQLGILFTGDKEILVEEFSASATPPKAFVVMQFSPEYNELYEEVIKHTCMKFGLEVVRADDMFTSSQILEDIIKSIKESSVVIADITADNPNVFYEVGYAHAINKPTILLSDKKRIKLPFDVSGFRTLFYENSIGGKRAVEENLYKYLQNISL